MQKFKFINNLLEDFKSFKKNFKNYYKEKPKKAFLITLIWLIIFILIVILNNYLINKSLENSSDFSSPSQNSDNVLFLENTGSDNYFVNQLKATITVSAPIFDNFIVYTADPNGHSSCSKNSETCKLSLASSDKLYFPSSHAEIPTTKHISGVLMKISVPILIIILSVQASNMILSSDNFNYRKLANKILIVIVLLILTPFIQSVLIIFVNQLSALILGEASLTTFLNKFVDSLESADGDTSFGAMVKNFLLKTVGLWNPVEFITSLPIIITIGLVVLVLLFISFQYILRFLSIYFLSSLYPIITICGAHNSTESILKSYWKQWVTYLLEQPIFVIGFALISTILSNIFNGGLSFESIIIFIGMLFFLGSINMFAGKLFGDVYSVISQNVTAGIAANQLKRGLIDKPLYFIGNSISNGNGFKFKDLSKPIFDTGKGDGGDNTGGKDALNRKSIKKPYSSQLEQELKGCGYDVKSIANTGKLSVSGKFIMDKGQKYEETNTLYTSRKDALRDGVNPQNMKEVSLKGLVLQDASNRRGIIAYNKHVKRQAAENNGHAKYSSLRYKSPDKNVRTSMNIARSYNLKNNIQAVGVRNDVKGGDKSISGDNVIKIHTYNQSLRNSMHESSKNS